MGIALGVLLAGGRGSRLGLGVPKALAPFAGGTLLSRALAVLRETCDRVVLCAPRDLELPRVDADRLDDPTGGGGPLPALAGALAWRPYDAALALAVDLPLLTPACLGAMRERLRGAFAVVPAPGGRAQPLAAWYGPAARLLLGAAVLEGERSVTRAALALGPRVLGDEELSALGADPRAFLNVNTADELAAAARLAAAAGIE